MTQSVSKSTNSPNSLIRRSKGGVLAALAGRLSCGEVLDLLSIEVDRWVGDRHAVLRDVICKFGRQNLIVRSDAWDEDGSGHTLAGHYLSRLDVPGWDRNALAQSIDAVIARYAANPGNRVLIQPMAGNVRLSGAASTHCISDGAPYIVIGCDDSGRTDVVTGGGAPRMTAYVHRSEWGRHLAPAELQPLLALLAEVELLFPAQPLELEFVLPAEGKPLVLQLRPLGFVPPHRLEDATCPGRQLARLARCVEARLARAPGLSGSRTILGCMPDWNPAEMIGARPRPFAVSLYRKLITRSTWRQARALMGYRILPDTDLMCELAGRPYIDVRSSFNSLLPQGLDPAIGEILIDRWLDRLEREPALHDRVELEVAQPSLAFDFDRLAGQFYADVLTPGAVATFREALRRLTCRCLLGQGAEGLATIHGRVRKLARVQRGRRGGPPDSHAIHGVAELPLLLRECRELGTLPFAMAARHAFIAEVLLASAQRRGALSPQRVADFRRSVRSIASRFAEDCRRLGDGSLPRRTFVARYGHLRPGTYDIRAERYADQPDLLACSEPAARFAASPTFELAAEEVRAIDRLLAECGLCGVRADALFTYARQAIALREYSKFVFTRHVSLVLELVAGWAHTLGFSRDDASYLALPDIASLRPGETMRDQAARLRETVAARRAESCEHDAIRLGPLIVRPADVYCFTVPAQTPSFVGSGRLTAPVARLDGTARRSSVAGRIVCVESADPGYDWIFAQGAGGLITQYGGPNSHMAVRCAEFGLPAALGCGETLFERIAGSAVAHLDCDGGIAFPASAS